MNVLQRDQIEIEARRLFDQGALEGAATAAIQGYGREIFSFLWACHRGHADTEEVFSLFAESLWRSLPSFGWQSSLRTWAYAVARRVSLCYRRDTHRRNRHEEPLPEDSAISRVAARVRSDTAPFLRSEVKSRVAALRASLAPEDQELLILRVDRELAWLDLADVLRGEDEPPLEGKAREREAARLRKRFQAIKQQIREMARQEGLLDSEGDPKESGFGGRRAR